MTPDDEMLMAYADGELDALTAKRVERAIAEDPELAARVAAHRRLRSELAAAFPLVAGRDPLETVIRSAPAPIARRRPPMWRQPWLPAAAMAACLVIGVTVGSNWRAGPIAADRSGALVASGTLARALDNQLASETGETRIVVSFRNTQGSYCRVFAGAATDGIACRAAGQWRLVRTGTGSAAARGDYRQAGSADMAMLEAAQAMMAGDRLDAAQEARARQDGWEPAKSERR